MQDGILATVESYAQLENGLPDLRQRDFSRPSKAEALLGHGQGALNNFVLRFHPLSPLFLKILRFTNAKCKLTTQQPSLALARTQYELIRSLSSSPPIVNLEFSECYLIPVADI